MNTLLFEEGGVRIVELLSRIVFLLIIMHIDNFENAAQLDGVADAIQVLVCLELAPFSLSLVLNDFISGQGDTEGWLLLLNRDGVPVRLGDSLANDHTKLLVLGLIVV